MKLEEEVLAERQSERSGSARTRTGAGGGRRPSRRRRRRHHKRRHLESHAGAEETEPKPRHHRPRAPALRPRREAPHRRGGQADGDGEGDGGGCGGRWGGAGRRPRHKRVQRVDDDGYRGNHPPATRAEVFGRG